MPGFPASVPETRIASPTALQIGGSKAERGLSPQFALSAGVQQTDHDQAVRARAVGLVQERFAVRRPVWKLVRRDEAVGQGFRGFS